MIILLIISELRKCSHLENLAFFLSINYYYNSLLTTLQSRKIADRGNSCKHTINY